MSRIGTIHEDITTDVIGVIGPWQWLVTIMCTICMVIPAMNQYADAFLLQPTAECIEPRSNASLCEFGNKTTREKCTRWQINFLELVWIRKSWLMFCDPKVKIVSTSVISRLGSIFGCVIFGLISDSFGRKCSMWISYAAEVGFRVVMVFCDSEVWFQLLVFLRTLFSQANIFMALILVCEIASNEWRTRLNVIAILPQTLAAVCLVSVANLVPNETFDFLVAVCSVLVLILLRWIPESPAWLLFEGKVSKAERILSKAAQMNKKYLDSDFQIKPVDQEAYIVLDEIRDCMKLCTKYNVRSLVIVTIAFWCLYYFIWNSLYIRVFYDKKDRNIILKVLCLVLGMMCLNISLMKKLNLRKLLVMNLVIIVFLETFLLLVHLSIYQETTVDIMLWTALSCGVMVQAIILNITPRLLATHVRATLLGFCHSAGHLGAILSSIVILLNAIDSISLMIANIVLSIVLLCLCYMLPDVDGRELPDVIQDMDYYSESSKPLRWAAHKNSSSSHEEIQIRVHSYPSTNRNSSAESRPRSLPPRRIGNILRAVSDLIWWLRN
ncbi:solute carrier family 22 member 13-like [Aricia agestis]|uniref:solute carrier family 22 member 13-like n=1 Tax=Aricia agestis TaxID=91739 RepID=UPI001C209D6D|nr:solute carrier family 22 member 13-like [Aricia agestis]